MNFAELKNHGREFLGNSSFFKTSEFLGSEQAAKEAELLVLAALEKEEKVRKDLSYLYLKANALVSDKIINRSKEYFERRAQAEPVAYILGRKEFYGREFLVNDSVLVPRPETEQLLELALSKLPLLKAPVLIYEVGVGSGCLIVSLILELLSKHGSLKDFSFLGNDISQKALDICSLNAKKQKVDNYLNLEQGDLLSNFNQEQTLGSCLLLSNLPYIGFEENLPQDVYLHEPHQALFSQDSGLADILRLLSEAETKLSSLTHSALLEIGHEHSAVLEAKIAEKNICPKKLEFHLDYSKVKRFLEISF